MNKNKKYIVSLTLLSLLTTVSAEENTKEKINNVTVVSAAGYEQNLIDASASISIVTKEDLHGKGYMDVSEALQDIPGVYFSNSATGSKGMGPTSISIRGLPSNYTLFLVNGKPQGNSGQIYFNGHGKGQDIGWLPPISAIERIEIIRGPMSSLYGSNALGGVINIITKKVLNEWAGELSINRTIQENSDAGAQQQYKYYLTGPIIKDVLGVSLDGMYTKRDEDSIDGGYKENIRKNTTAKFNWIVNDNNNLEFEYGYFIQKNKSTEDGSGSDSGGYREVTKKNFGLAHDLYWTEDIVTKTYYKMEDMDNEFQNGGTGYDSNLINSKTVIPFDSNNMTAGIEYKKEEMDSGTRGKNIQFLERWSGALFIEDEYFVSDDLSITAGARWNEDEKYGGKLTPRVYGVYKLSSNLIIKGGISTGYITPDLKKGDTNWVEGGGGGGTDGADIGNDDLIPENSLSYEIGLIYDNPNGYNFSFTAFKTDFEDKIQKATICDRKDGLDTNCNITVMDYDFEKVYQYYNADEAELEGIEISTGYDFDTVSLNANYTYTTSEVTKGTNKGAPLSNQPKSKFNVGINWAANKDLNVWSKLKYTGKNIEAISTSRRGTTKYPGFTIVDLGASYNVSENLSTHLNIYNALDKQVSSKSFDGRRYIVGINYTF